MQCKQLSWGRENNNVELGGDAGDGAGDVLHVGGEGSQGEEAGLHWNTRRGRGGEICCVINKMDAKFSS